MYLFPRGTPCSDCGYVFGFNDNIWETHSRDEGGPQAPSWLACDKCHAKRDKNMNRQLIKTKEKDTRPVCLFDMDGVLCNYDETLMQDLNRLRDPSEPEFQFLRDKEPAHIKARMDLIRSSPEWWKKLPYFLLGMTVYDTARKVGFRPVICTQGPRINADAWKGKVEWCLNNLIPTPDIVITRDKSLIYGRVLVDDFPEYIESWLEFRPRGLVIMPAHHYNETFKHKNVVRYDGSNFCEVHGRLTKAYNRKPKEEE